MSRMTTTQELAAVIANLPRLPSDIGRFASADLMDFQLLDDQGCEPPVSQEDRGSSVPLHLAGSNGGQPLAVANGYQLSTDQSTNAAAATDGSGDLNGYQHGNGNEIGKTDGSGGDVGCFGGALNGNGKRLLRSAQKTDRKRSVRLTDFVGPEDPEYHMMTALPGGAHSPDEHGRLRSAADGLAALAAADGDASEDDLDDNDRSKSSNCRREKNRLAARKCRAKKMQYMVDMESKVCELARKNQEMHVQLLTLQKMFSREVKLREAMKVIIGACWSSANLSRLFPGGWSASDVVIALESGTLDINALVAVLTSKAAQATQAAGGGGGGGATSALGSIPAPAPQPAAAALPAVAAAVAATARAPADAANSVEERSNCTTMPSHVSAALLPPMTSVTSAGHSVPMLADPPPLDTSMPVSPMAAVAPAATAGLNPPAQVVPGGNIKYEVPAAPTAPLPPPLQQQPPQSQPSHDWAAAGASRQHSQAVAHVLVAAEQEYRELLDKQQRVLAFLNQHHGALVAKHAAYVALTAQQNAAAKRYMEHVIASERRDCDAAVEELQQELETIKPQLEQYQRAFGQRA